MEGVEKSRSWWQSVPVVLTAAATILGSTAALVANVDKAGWFATPKSDIKVDKLAAVAAPSIFTREFRVARGGGTPDTQHSPQLDESVEFETAGELQMRFQVASRACSQIRLGVLVDNKLVKETMFFDEDTGMLNLGPVSPGKHTLTLRPEGRINGCNSGTLESWGGTLTLQVST